MTDVEQIGAWSRAEVDAFLGVADFLGSSITRSSQ